MMGWAEEKMECTLDGRVSMSDEGYQRCVNGKYVFINIQYLGPSDQTLTRKHNSGPMSRDG